MNSQTIRSGVGVDMLIQEILEGNYVKDILPNSAFGFTGEHQAMYFSNLRRNLKSDMAHAIMSNSQSLDDLNLLKKIKE